MRRGIPERDGFGLCTGERGHNDPPGACLAQHRGAGPGGGAGGVDIVDEQDVAAGHRRSLGHGKGGAQVVATLARVEAELAFCLADTGENAVRGPQAQGGVRAAQLLERPRGEQFGLVEATLTGLAARQGNGGDEGFDGRIETWCQLRDALGEKAAERIGGRAQAVKLQQADQLAQGTGVHAKGNGPGEGRGNAAARGADLIGGMAAGEEAFTLKAESFAADGAEKTGMGLRLGAKRAETDLADGKGGGVKQGSGTDAAIAGEERRDQVIEGAARDAANRLQKPRRSTWDAAVLRRTPRSVLSL